MTLLNESSIEQINLFAANANDSHHRVASSIASSCAADGMHQNNNSESYLSSSVRVTGGDNNNTIQSSNREIGNGKKQQQQLELSSMPSKSDDGSAIICDESQHSTNGSPKQNKSNANHGNAATEETSLVETKANEIVMSIVGAVSTLGHAVHQNGTRGLSDALRNQKDGFVRCARVSIFSF